MTDMPPMFLAVLSSFALGVVALWGFVLCRSERAPAADRPRPDPGSAPVPAPQERASADVIELDRARRRRSA